MTSGSSKFNTFKRGTRVDTSVKSTPNQFEVILSNSESLVSFEWKPILWQNPLKFDCKRSFKKFNMFKRGTWVDTNSKLCIFSNSELLVSEINLRCLTRILCSQIYNQRSGNFRCKISYSHSLQKTN